MYSHPLCTPIPYHRFEATVEEAEDELSDALDQVRRNFHPSIGNNDGYGGVTIDSSGSGSNSGYIGGTGTGSGRINALKLKDKVTKRISINDQIAIDKLKNQAAPFLQSRKSTSTTLSNSLPGSVVNSAATSAVNSTANSAVNSTVNR